MPEFILRYRWFWNRKRSGISDEVEQLLTQQERITTGEIHSSWTEKPHVTGLSYSLLGFFSVRAQILRIWNEKPENVRSDPMGCPRSSGQSSKLGITRERLAFLLHFIFRYLFHWHVYLFWYNRGAAVMALKVNFYRLQSCEVQNVKK